MGVLSDFFVASDAELAKVGDTGAAEGMKVLEAKGFGVVPFESLGKCMKVKKALEPGEPPAHGEAYEWVAMKATKAMVEALAALDDAALETHAAALAKTPELGWKPAEVAALLRPLRALAQQARASERGLYLWMST
jgi:hypothetical protein